MANMLVLYYSSWGHVEKMAYAQAEGVAKVNGMSADVKRVPELVSDDVARKFGYQLDQKAPIADPLELGNYEGIIFGAPTRFGNMCAQMRNFLDQTGAAVGEERAARQGRQRLHLHARASTAARKRRSRRSTPRSCTTAWSSSACRTPRPASRR